METIETGIKQLVIRPVNKVKFSGVSSYARTKTVFAGAELNQNGLYNTGLTPTQEKHYEQVLNLAPGTLGRKSLYWADVEISLWNDKPTYFNLSGPLDEIKESVIKAHSKIANSELSLAKTPSALFYIDDVEEKAKLEAMAIDYELQATDLFVELSLEDKKAALRVYGKAGIDDMSETMVKAELYKFVKKDPIRFVKMLSDKARMLTRALLEELIEKKIVTKKGAYFYHNEDMIGNSTDGCLDYLEDPKNQSVKIAMVKRMKELRKSK